MEGKVSDERTSGSIVGELTLLSAELPPPILGADGGLCVIEDVWGTGSMGGLVLDKGAEDRVR